MDKRVNKSSVDELGEIASERDANPKDTTSECLPRPEGMKAAAELVFLADEEGSLAPIAEEPALPVALNNRDIHRPDFQQNGHTESATGIDKAVAVAVAFDGERETDAETEIFVQDRVAATIDGNLPTAAEGSATNEAERVETPSFQPRPPISELLPGAYRVPGPGADPVGDDCTIGPPTVTESPTVTANPTVEISSAELVDADEENRVIEQRVEQRLQEIRVNAAVAQIVPDNEGDPLPAPKRWIIFSLDRGEIILAVITSVLFVAAIILWILFATTKEDPTNANAFPTKSLFTTTRAQDGSMGSVPTSPTPETEIRQSSPAPTSSGLPLQIVQVDDIRMVISGVSTLSSSSSQATWAQATINFVANAVGQALVQQTSGYVELALEMSTWTSSLTNDGKLQMDFGLTLNIKSSTTFSHASARIMVLNGFDDNSEKFAYITALKNTDDSAFENASGVEVTIDSVDQGGEDTPTPSQVETDVTTIAPTLSPQSTSASPTAAATLPIQRFEAKNLAMVLEGMEPMYLVAQSIWQDETAAFIKSEIGNLVSSEETLGVSIDFASQDPPYEGGGRGLQDAKQVLKIKFHAVVSIRSESKEYDVNQYVTSAFESTDQEETYIGILKATGHEAFENLSGVSVTTTSEDVVPSSSEPTVLSKKTSIKIAAIVVTVLAGLSATALKLMVSFRKKRNASF
jgi:hypothetical protein